MAVLADGGWKYLSADFWTRPVPARSAQPRRPASGGDSSRGALGNRRARRGGAPERGLRPDRAARRRRGALLPGRNRAASPYRFDLEIDPEVWFLEDDGYELAVFHSHPRLAPAAVAHRRRVDRPLGGQAHVILSPRTGELAGWTIADEAVHSLPLS